MKVTLFVIFVFLLFSKVVNTIKTEIMVTDEEYQCPEPNGKWFASNDMHIIYVCTDGVLKAKWTCDVTFEYDESTHTITCDGVMTVTGFNNEQTTHSTTIKTNPTIESITTTPKPTITPIKTTLTDITLSTIIPKICPNVKNIYPCICDSSSWRIHCFGQSLNNNLIDLIAPNIGNYSYEFDSITISNTSITYLQKYLFRKAKFDNIFIRENLFLEKIDSQVFTDSEIKSFIVTKNPKLSDKNIFELIQNLSPLEVILSDNAFDELPEYAFVDEENAVNGRLTRILLDNNQIKVIPSDAFTGLTNLKYLSLKHNMINTVEDYGLKMSSFLGHLDILLNNNYLNSQSFTLRSIDIPKNITLKLDLSENNISFLKESVFKDILSRDNCEVNVFGNKLNCECNMKWLLNMSFNKNMFNAFCQNLNKSFVELNPNEIPCKE